RVQVHADGTGGASGLVVGEDGCAEGAPRQHEPRRKRVQVRPALHVRELLEPPALHLPTGRVQRVLRRDLVRIPLLLEELALPTTVRRRLVSRRPPPQRPVARELLERGPEAREEFSRNWP